MISYAIKNGDPTNRRTKVGRCIYCGDIPVGEEHIIPEALGGTLVLDTASCRACETDINAFERNILTTVLYVPRIAMKLRRKRRKRLTPDKVRVPAKIRGKEIFVELPISEMPAMFFLVQMTGPDLLLGRQADQRGPIISGAWVCPVQPHGYRLPGVSGLQSVASPVMDTHHFCRFLAKIAHGFAVHCLGLDGFEPMLQAYIRNGGVGWDKVGGTPTITPKTDNLHELSLAYWPIGNETLVVVTIRLFASLGAPSYLVVVGKAKPR